MKLFSLIIILSFYTNSFSQTLSSTNGANVPGGGFTNCSNCVPSGWIDNGGTPDVSNSTQAATTGTGGGGGNWIVSPTDPTLLTLPLPPNGHTRWLSLRDLGSGGTEESVRSTISGMTVGRQYEVTAYTLTAVANNGLGGYAYAGTYNNSFRFSTTSSAVTSVSPLNVNTWGTSKMRFEASATSEEIFLRPGNDSGFTGSVATRPLIETVQVSISFNAVNDVPEADDDSATITSGGSVDINVVDNDNDFNDNIDPSSVDLDPNTPGIQSSITTAQGDWSVDNMGVVTFTPVAGFIGVATLDYTVDDDFVLDGVNSPSTSNPATISVTVNPLPTISLGDVTVTEGTDSEAVIPVSISNPSDTDVVVTVTVTSGTAGTADYVETAVMVTIPAGETMATVPVGIVDDNIDESTEEFTVVGTSPDATTSSPATVTILDDPNDVPTISLGDVTVTEGTDSYAVVPVTLTNPSDTDIVVVITTTTGTAGTDDYTETTITVVIPAGETMVTVSIPITDDTIFEPTETFSVNGNVTTVGATTNTDPKGTVTIINNLVHPNLSIVKTVDNPTPNANGVDEVMFTITVTNNSTNVDAVNVIVSDQLPSGYEFVSATHSTGSDPEFNSSNNTVTWNVGTIAAGTSETLLITVIVLENVDGTLEYNNTAYVTDATDPGAVLGSTAEVKPTCLTVYNIFTPNGDGDNDYLQIDCIEQYPGATIDIWNRWGNTVYTATDYKNDWDGTSNGRAVLNAGDKLPAGTYFYAIDLKNGSPVIKGWIQIAY